MLTGFHSFMRLLKSGLVLCRLFQCFSCATCRNQLVPGDRFHYVNGTLFCEHDRPGAPLLNTHLQNNPVLADQKVSMIFLFEIDSLQDQWHIVSFLVLICITIQYKHKVIVSCRFAEGLLISFTSSSLTSLSHQRPSVSGSIQQHTFLLWCT